MTDAHAGGPAAAHGAAPGGGGAARVFVSYAHDDQAHEERVREFWLFLRGNGIDARLDLPTAERRVDWGQWMTQEARDADRVLVVASPDYKKRADGDARPAEGRGVQWEARLIRDLFYADQEAGLQRILPVVLPGCSAADIPLWLGPASTTHYLIRDYTVDGAEKLLRVLTGQPAEVEPPLGQVPVLAARDGGTARPGLARPGLRTEVVIEAALDAGVLTSAVWVAGSLLSQRREPLPPEVTGVWAALRLPGTVAADRVADAGRRIAAALLPDEGQEVLAGLLGRLPAGDTAEVVLYGGGAALALPVELIRLRTGPDSEAGPLGLLAGVSITRRIAMPGREPGQPPGPPTPAPPVTQAGPLKVLAVVAAPDETKTANPPLDTEAEMDAVLNAVAGLTKSDRADGGQVRILEVASLPAIRQALDEDAYHVLHLSAHGSPDTAELEDEDGAPVPVTTAALVRALRQGRRRCR